MAEAAGTVPTILTLKVRRAGRPVVEDADGLGGVETEDTGVGADPSLFAPHAPLRKLALMATAMNGQRR
jgi:hypothetical protein